MSITLTNIFLVMVFVLLALKWLVTGYFGRISGQLIFVLPLFLFLYLSIITIFLKKSLAANGELEGSRKCVREVRLSRAGKVQAILLFLYLLIISVALFRSVGVSERFTPFIMVGRFLSIVAMASAGWFIFRTYARKKHLDRVWTFITLGLGLYVIINITGAVLGIKNPFVESLDLIKSDTVFSFWDIRISFPFSANHQAFAVEAGLLGALALAQLLQPQSRHRCLYVLILLLALGCSVATNTRIAILGLMAVALASVTWRIGGRRLILPALGIILILPVFFTYVDILPWLEGLATDFSFLTRKEDLAELATLNNRTMIWEHAFDELRNLKAIHLFGYGAFGHVVTGASYDYAAMWKNPELITFHNAYIQHLIDYGYLGLFVLLGMIVNAIMVLGRYKINAGKKDVHALHPALVAIVYLAVYSLADNAIYFYQALPFFVFIFINYHVICNDAATGLHYSTTAVDRSEG